MAALGQRPLFAALGFESFISDNRPRVLEADRQLSLPSFMALDFDPQKGIALNICTPLSTGQRVTKGVCKLIIDTTIGTIIGCVGGGATGVAYITHEIWNGRMPVWEEARDRIQSFAAGGAVGGGVIGFMHGSWKVSQYLLKGISLEQTLNSPASVAKAQNVMRAFIDTHVESSVERGFDITCPITHEVMAYPVKTNCQPIPHTFEYTALAASLTRTPTCPMCRRHITLASLSKNRDKETEIVRVAQDIFREVEKLLRPLPRTIFDTVDLATIDEVTYISEQVEAGKPLLAASEDELVEKVRHPEQLTREERYALGFYLVQQFKPLHLKIREIYETVQAHLVGSQANGELSEEHFLRMRIELDQWLLKMKKDFVPADCPTVRHLYTLRG